MKKINRLYYIEESVFSTEKLYRFLEALFNDSSVEPYFAVDSKIQDTIKKYYSIGLLEEAYDIQTYIYFFANRKKLEYIDVNEYLDLDNFVVKTIKYDEIYVLTQQEKIFDCFKPLKSSKLNIRLYCMKHHNIVEWKETKKQQYTAFYIKDDNYVNPVDVEKISFVYSPKYGFLKLDKSTAISGGEGICYKTYNNMFVKLYNKNHLNYVNYKKLQKMLEMDITNEYILWPLDIVYYNNNYVGYVMKELKGCENIDDMRDIGFQVDGMSPIDRYKVALNFLKQVDYLHKKNILVGDMKPDNILVQAPNNLYIIDSGSFQIEDYCCAVCHPVYTELTYTGDELRTNLRTVENEYFPINRILFEILMLKSPFFNRANIEVNEEGNRKFEYPMSKASVVGDVIPIHIRLWFYMSDKMRQFFYNYFVHGKITDLSEWIRELELFIKQKEV